MPNGKVYLVGAGAGDPGLITLRAVELLSRVDAVLYDYLVNPAVLRHCRADALKISLGKHGTGRVFSQAEINEQLIALARQGKSIVRLKSGDPLVFARAAEELDCLVQHGIAFEIVPGVTAALAAASYVGLPVTDRENASAVALVTGQEDADKVGTSIDYAALASFPGTLVFYMGVTTVSHWSGELLAAGKPADTPVAVVRRVSFPDQQRWDTTLGQLAALVEERRLRPPAVFILGDVSTHAKTWSWFEKRPMFGQTVLVTRPLNQADDLARPLAELGARVLVQPAISIEPPASGWSAVDSVLEQIERFDWVVFSSANGVRFFLDRLPAIGRDLRQLGKTKIACIGSGTAAEVASYRLTADLIPDEFRAESLAALLTGSASGKRFLLVRASRGREVLAEELANAGGHVEQVVAYESRDVEQPDSEIASLMNAGRIDWTTVTSSAIARSLVNLFGDALEKTKLASISPITTATLHELGLKPAAEAKEYTMAGVTDAIRDAA